MIVKEVLAVCYDLILNVGFFFLLVIQDVGDDPVQVMQHVPFLSVERDAATLVVFEGDVKLTERVLEQNSDAVAKLILL